MQRRSGWIWRGGRCRAYHQRIHLRIWWLGIYFYCGCNVLFAFSTIIGWGLYGTRCIEFLFGTRANKPFMILYALVAIVGATMNLGLMWNIAETFNGLMVIPNLIAVFLLSGVVVKLVKEYFEGEGKTK